MSKMSKEETLRFILDYLHDNPDAPGISQSDLAAVTGKTSRTSFYNAINDLKNAGYKFTESKLGKEAYYHIENLSELYNYKLASTKDYYKYLIIETLNKYPEGMLFQNPKSRDSMSKYAGDDSYNYLCDKLVPLDCESIDYDVVPINIKTSALRTILKEMEREGTISISRPSKAGDVYKSKVSKYYLESDSKSLGIAWQRLTQIPEGHKNFALLSAVRNKLCLELFHKTDFETYDDNYIIYGRKKHSFKDIKRDLAILSATEYTRNVVKITYRADGINTQTLFAVGLIIYSEVSDEFYILGKSLISKNDAGKYCYLTLSDILVASDTDIKNQEYHSQFYFDMLTSSLDVSVSSQEEIKMRFTVGYLPTLQKLTRLNDARHSKKSSITALHHDGQVTEAIYKDSISDIDSLKSYILGFGGACTVEAPESFRNDIKAELEATLEAYRKEGYNV